MLYLSLDLVASSTVDGRIERQDSIAFDGGWTVLCPQRPQRPSIEKVGLGYRLSEKGRRNYGPQKMVGRRDWDLLYPRGFRIPQHSLFLPRVPRYVRRYVKERAVADDGLRRRRRAESKQQDETLDRKDEGAERGIRGGSPRLRRGRLLPHDERLPRRPVGPGGAVQEHHVHPQRSQQRRGGQDGVSHDDAPADRSRSGGASVVVRGVGLGRVQSRPWSGRRQGNSGSISRGQDTAGGRWPLGRWRRGISARRIQAA